jgi:hypothetical protein
MISITGKEKTLAFRKLFLLNALRTEIDTGRRLTNKVPSAYSIIKKEYKLTGNKENVYRQFFFKLVDEKILVVKS